MKKQAVLAILAVCMVVGGLLLLSVGASGPSAQTQDNASGGAGLVARQGDIGARSAVRSEGGNSDGLLPSGGDRIVFQVLSAVDLDPQPFSHVGFLEPDLGVVQSDDKGKFEIDFEELPSQLLVAVGGFDLVVFTSVEARPIPIVVPATNSDVTVSVADPAGNPVAGAAVLARLSDPDVMDPSSLDEVALGLTGDDGRVSVLARPGALVYATKSGWACSMHGRVQGRDVQLVLRQAAELVVRLELDRASAVAPDWSRFTVRVLRQSVVRGITWGHERYEESRACAADGTAAFEAIPDGVLHIQASDRDGAYWASGRIDIDSRASNQIRLSVKPRIAPLAVTVFDESGGRVPGAGVRLKFGGDRFESKADATGCVRFAPKGSSFIRPPSGIYGTLFGWHPEVGQAKMDINADMLASGAALVLRRNCTVRVVPRLLRSGPVVLEVTQELARGKPVTQSLLCAEGGCQVAISAPSAQVAIRRDGCVVGFAEVNCDGGDYVIEEFPTGAVRGDVRSGGELPVGEGYLHLRDVDNGRRHTVWVSADATLLPARIPVGEYEVVYYNESAAMAMALSSPTVRVLPGDTNWSLVAIPKGGLVVGVVDGPAGFPVEIEITREGEGRALLSFHALTGISWRYGLMPGRYSIAWAARDRVEGSMSVTISLGKVSELICR